MIFIPLRHSFILISFFILLILPADVNAISFHFYLNHNHKRCFYKELTRGHLLIGRYKLEIYDPETDSYIIPRDKTDTGTLIDVEETFDSNHRVVHQRGSASGQFTFSALDSGEHRICMTPKSFYKKKWLDGGGSNPSALKDSKFTKSRLTMDFLIGDGNNIDSKHTHRVETLAHQVNGLNDKLIDIIREQRFIREKEAQFRDLSENTNEHVVKWLVIQVGALLIACIFQMFKLLSFFLKEKIA